MERNDRKKKQVGVSAAPTVRYQAEEKKKQEKQKQTSGNKNSSGGFVVTVRPSYTYTPPTTPILPQRSTQAQQPAFSTWEDFYENVDLDAIRKQMDDLKATYKMQGTGGDIARWIGSKAYAVYDTLIGRRLSDADTTGKFGAFLDKTMGAMENTPAGYLAEVMGRDETTGKIADLQKLYNIAEERQRYKGYEKTVADFEKRLDATHSWDALEEYKNPTRRNPDGSAVNAYPLPSADWETPVPQDGTFDVNPDYSYSAQWDRGRAEAMRGFQGTGITEDQIKAYLDAKTLLENRELTEERIESENELAEKSPWGAALVTAKNVPRGLVAGAAGSLSAAFDKMQGKPVDWNDPYIRPGQVKKETTRQITEDIAEDSKIGAQAYQLGTSALDSLSVALLARAGVPAWVGAAMMGGSAAQQTMLDAHERGLDDAHAVSTGIAAGIAETVFEKFSLENFVKTPPVDAPTFRGQFFQALKNTGVQGVIEGSEELFTSLANQIYDRMKNGGLSEYEINVRQYMEDGKSRAEAEKMATDEFCKSIGADFAGGLLLGGVMGGVATGINTAAENANARGIYGADSAALVQEALELDPNNKTALEAQKRLEQGKKLSGATMRALVEQNEARLKEQMQSTETGETDSHGTQAALGMTEETDTSSVAYGETFPSRGRLETETVENSGRAQRPASMGANVTARSTGDRATTRRVGELGNGGRAIYETLRDMTPNLSDRAYRDAFAVAYETGRATAQGDAERGLAMAQESTEGLGLPEEVVQAAYLAGREDVAWENENGARVTDTSSVAYGDTFPSRGRLETEKGESYGTEGQQGVRVRDGGQRAAGAYSGGYGQAVVADTGEAAQGRGRAGGAADGGAAEVRVAEKVRSSADLIGSTRGSRTDKLRLVTGNLSPAMQKAEGQARSRGLTPYFYTGGYMTVDGETCRGFIRGNTVYIRADDPNYTADQIMRHEAGHDAIAKGEIDPADVYETLAEKYGQEGLDAILDAYGEDYAGGGMTTDQIWEEIVCDSLGDMGVFAENLSAVAPELAEVLNAVKDETLRQGTRRALEGRGQNKTAAGESSGKMSFVRATDSEFRQADVMERSGASEAAIWKETGMIRDAAGNWVTEISDREAKYYPNGDAQFRADHPEYARYQDLVEKFIMGTITESEATELNELRPTWSQEQKRLAERVKNGNATLQNVLRHDALFERIPALRNVPFRIVEELGAWGQRGGDGIALSKDLDAALRKGTVLHEVQHEIQHQEERPSGANEEYWQDRINRGTAPRSHDSQVRDAEARRDAAWEQMDEETRKQVRAINRENLKAQETGDFTRWNEMDEAMRNSDQGELYEAYDDAMFDLRTATEYNRDMDARELYHNTAGEIEARLTESRREMTEEQRREKVPDFQKNKAVFAENTAGYVMSEDESASVKKQLRNNEKVLLQMEPVTTISYDGWDGLSKAAFVKKVFSMLRRSGLKVDRKGFGVIELTETDINRSLDYIRTAGEAAAYQAIPRVLKRGIQIDEHKDHKWRGYDTTTIAAPIEIDGVRVNMAVVVKMTKGYRYKVHRVLTPEGTTFHLPGKANAEPTTGGGITRVAYSRGGVAPPISSASMNSISDQSAKSNPQKDNGHKSRVGDSMEQLQQENEELRGQVKAFQKALKATERKLADARESRDNWRNKATFSPERVGRDIIKAYDGSVSENEIHDDVKKLIDYAARKDGITYEELKRLAAPAAARVVKSASTVSNGEEVQTWEDMKKHLRATRIKVSQAAINDFTEWGTFWRKNGRRLNLVTGKDGAPVDVAYAELGEKFGYAYFPSDITHPADQLRRIAEVYDNLQPVFDNPYSLNMALAAERCANDLVDMTMAEVARGYKATYAGQLQEQVYQSRQYTQKLLEQERTRSDERVKELKKHWQAQRRAEIEGREDSELRTRLLNVAKRLKNRKLPTVSRALLNQYAQDMLTETQREIFDKLDTESKGMRKSTREGLEWLRDQYETLKDTDPNFIPDPATEERIKRLSRKQIDSLSHQDVVELTYALLNIENEIRNEKKLIDSAEKRDLFEAGLQVMDDIRNAPGSKASGVSAVLDRFIVTETLSPMRQVRRMVGYADGDPLLVATRELADGQRRSFDYKMRAQKRFQSFVDDKAFMESIAGKKAKTMTIRGIGENGPVTVEITPAMKISLYLHSRNNQSLTHIAGGGVRVPDMALYRKGQIAKAYDRGTVITLEPRQVKSLAAELTAREKQFADAVYDYFNTMSKSEVNTVSEKLLGYPVAEVENYFPINTDDSFTRKEFESIKFDGSVEGMGFLKERIKSAAPIYLRDVTDVLTRSIDQHAKYVGLGVPVRNFNKLWGVTAKNVTDEGGPGASSALQSLVRQQWGGEGRGYIEKMMRDLQSGGKEQNVWGQALGRVRSKYAGAVLTLNASVAMKQAASYPTAAAVVGWGPLAKAFKSFGKVDLELIAAYTPLQWYRSQGYSTQELGDMAKRGIQLPPWLNWVQAADVLTTRKLWKAAEIYVSEQQPGLKKGSAEDIRQGRSPYYKAVAEVYDRIIEETQPNYTTMQRPQLLRSDDTLLQNLQMFKTQPFQNFNILYDAIGELQARERTWKVDPSEQNAAAVKAAKKKAALAVSSQAVQLAVFAAMTLLWNAFRGKKDKYQDKEGDMTLLSTLKGVGLDMIGGLFSEIPFGGDAWNFVSAKITGGKYYGVDDVTTAALNDALTALSNAGSTVSGLLTGEITDINTARLKLDSVADAVTKVLGWPYENVLNLGKAIFRQGAQAIKGDYMGQYDYLKLTTSPEKTEAYYDLLYEAHRKDPAAHAELYRQMVADGWDPKKIKNAIEDRMKKAEGVNSVKDLKVRYEAP